VKPATLDKLVILKDNQGSDVDDKPAQCAASRQTAKFKNGHVTITTHI